MKKLDYLKEALTKTELFNDKRWLISLLAITMPVDESKASELTDPYSLIRTFTGMSFLSVGETGERVLVPIDDFVPNAPLFTVRDRFTVDHTWASNIKEKQETQLGNVIINAVAVNYSLGTKIDFVNGKIGTSTLEKLIAPRLVDTTDEKVQEGMISVKEKLEFDNQLYFLTNIADIINITATPKNIVVAPNMKAERTKLLAQYGDSITDPVKLAELEGKLQAIDDEYLKDDPSAKVFIQGKIKYMGRKQMYVIFGDEAGFEEKTKATPITNALDDGWETTAKAFPGYINALRSGAFSRGAETIKGGVVNKTILRAFGSFKVSKKDCGTKMGFVRLIEKSNVGNLVGRSVKVTKGAGPWHKVKDAKEASTYLGNFVETRSPLYCRAEGDVICSECLSPYYADNEDSIAVTTLGVGAAILSMFMAAMHGKILSTVDVSLEEMCG
jgi:hypothetical protein